MPLADITRDETYLSKQGSAYMGAREVDADGSELGVPDAVYKNFGFLADFVYERTSESAGEPDVAGTNHNNTTTVTAKLTTKIMQRDADTINLPKDFTGYLRVTAEATQKALGAGGDIGQFFTIAAAKLPEGFKLDMKDLYPQWDWECLPNTSGLAITEDLTDFTGFLGAGIGTSTIGVGEYEAFKEFTYPP